MSVPRFSSLQQAGPNVQTIFVRRSPTTVFRVIMSMVIFPPWSPPVVFESIVDYYLVSWNLELLIVDCFRQKKSKTMVEAEEKKRVCDPPPSSLEDDYRYLKTSPEDFRK
jgi:hypothetical protein